MRAVAVLALLVLLAGCFGPARPADAVPFDGAAALGWVKAVALRDDGSPRFRIPSTEGQREGAAVLWGATAVSGWTRSWQNFTGTDYLALDRSVVRGYTPGPEVVRRYCSEAAEAKVPGLAFANLLVVRAGTHAGAPLVLLGAHWDSQMHSDNDPDPSKRGLPDPGANDGASGVGVLLQLMRHLDAMAPLPFSVGILFIDGEDGFYDCYPDAGSLYFAQHPLVAASSFVLLDMVGDPGALYPKESYSRSSAPALQDLLWSHGQALPGGAAHFVNTTTTIEDDHLAFIQAKVPSVDVIDAGRLTTFPPQWDTTFDTVDRLDATMLGLVGETLARTLADPAFSALLRAPGSA